MATILKNPDPPVFTYATAADYLGMTSRQVRDAVARREIDHVKLGRFTRFTRTMLDGYLDANTHRARG